MKVVTYILLVLVAVGGIGFGAYQLLSGMAADRASEEATRQLESPEQKETAKTVVEENPVLKDFIEEGAQVELESAELQTKEEAVQVIVEKFNPVELMELRNQAEDGLSEEEQKKILSKLENKLTEEQLKAIKAIAYQELYR